VKAFVATTTGAAAFRKAADWFFEKRDERLNMTLHYTMTVHFSLKRKTPLASRQTVSFFLRNYLRFLAALRFFATFLTAFFTAFFAVFFTAFRFFAAMVVVN
jgi:hypothetical protein